MLEYIISWICNTIADILTWLVNIFLSAMQLDLGTFYNVFPIVGTTYEIFRGVGVGLVAIIAGLSVLKFFSLGLNKAEDTPVGLLVGALVATAMVYFGGNLVEYAVDLGNIPYSIFSATAKSSASNLGNFTGAGLIEAVKSNNQVSGSSILLGSAGLTLLTLIILVLIAVNIIKLMLEIVERFLVICVLAYTAPLAFATIASATTRDIFKRWVSMFLSELILMSLGSWTLSLVLVGLNTATEATSLALWLELIFCYAMCKVGLRMDDYLRTLGLAPAHTGDDLFGDALGMAKTLGGLFSGFTGGGGKSGGKGSVLGSDTGSPILGGIGGAAVGAFHRGRAALTNENNRDAAGRMNWKKFGREVATGAAIGSAGPLLKNRAVSGAMQTAARMHELGPERRQAYFKAIGERNQSELQALRQGASLSGMDKKAAEKMASSFKDFEAMADKGINLSNTFRKNAAVSGTGTFRNTGGMAIGLNENAKNAGLMMDGGKVSGMTEAKSQFMAEHLAGAEMLDKEGQTYSETGSAILKNTAKDMTQEEALSTVWSQDMVLSKDSYDSMSEKAKSNMEAATQSIVSTAFTASTKDISARAWKEMEISNTAVGDGYGKEIRITYADKQNAEETHERIIIDKGTFDIKSKSEQAEYKISTEIVDGKAMDYYVKDALFNPQRHHGLAPATGYEQVR